MKTIKSPEEVSLLMEELWFRHIDGIPQSGCNIYMVELPPPTKEELAKDGHKSQGNISPDYKPEELYGAWI